MRVTNPLAENEAYLRRSVLDSLARRAEYNLARMQGNLRLFEIGSAFEAGGGRLPLEELRVGALVMGRRQPPHFTDPKSDDFAAWAAYDEWDAKALASAIASAVYPGGTIGVAASDANDSAVSRLTGGANSSALWTVNVDGRSVGVVRRLALDAPVWAAPAFGVEVSLGVMSSDDVAPIGKSAYRAAEKPRQLGHRFTALPSMPASEFDLALSVPDGCRLSRSRPSCDACRASSSKA